MAKYSRLYPRESILLQEPRMRIEMGKRVSKRRENIPEGEVGRWVLSLSNLGLPSLHGDLLYSSPGAPSSAPFWTVQGMSTTVSCRHFGRLTYKFYGAWWLRAASWRCFSGFVVLEKFMFYEPGVFIYWLDSIFAKKNSACFGSIGARFWRETPTLPLYHEGKVI